MNGEVLLGKDEDQQGARALRISETTGRPVGSPEWVKAIELQSGRSLAPKKPGAEAEGGDG